MKKFFPIIILLIVLSTCKQRNQYPVISGQIDGYYGKPIHIFSVESVYNGKPYGQSNASTYTNKKGEFCVRLMDKGCDFYQVITEEGFVLVESPILISSEDSVHVKTSIFNTTFPVFSGDNAFYNNYIVELSHSLSVAFRSNLINRMSEDDFKAYVDSIHITYLGAIDSLLIIQKKNSFGTELLQAELDLFLAVKRLEYLKFYNYETQALWQYYKPKEEFYSFLDGLLDRTSKFWFLPNFSLAVEAILEDEFQKIKDYQGKGDQIFDIKLRLIEKKFDGISKEVALSQLAKRFPEYLTYPNFFFVLDNADSLMKKYSSKSSLKEYFNQQKERVLVLKPGSVAPDFSLPDRFGNMVSLSSFRGNVVLLFFWGTWCPPCLSSIPKYLAIQKQFHDRDVSFIFIALEARNSDVEWWKEFIQGKGEMADELLEGKDFTGVHLVAQKQFQNREIQQYAITYAPSYVLIDREGHIASPRVLLDDELANKIEQLLNNP